MSQWTHITAAIRYNYLEMLMGNSPIDMGCFGKPVGWEDDFKSEVPAITGSPTLPCGSEGSLDYEIIKSKDESSLGCRDAIFHGDLRDYDDVEEILEYFKEITTKDKYMVRSGVLEIDVEFKRARVFRFDIDTKEWVEYVPTKGFYRRKLYK